MSQEKWIVDGPKVIDLELVRRLKVTLIGGKVDILTHDEPTARVEVHSVQGRDLKISIDGDSLEIDHPQLRWDNFIDVFSSFAGKAKADVSILIPKSATLTLGVISASALVSGLHADARVNTVSGEIVVDGTSGRLDVNAVSGEVSVSGHHGTVYAKTVSGEVTVAGEIVRLAADGISGSVVVDSAIVPQEISGNTVSGDLTVRLPEGADARYAFNTVSGTIQLDHETVRGTRGRGYNGKVGSLDREFAEIRANSVSGDITVIRTGMASESAAPGSVDDDTEEAGA